MMWKEKRVLLAILAVLLLGNIAFFFTYRVQYVNRLADLEARQEDAKRDLVTARTARIKAEQQVKAYADTRKEIDSIYKDRWATQEQRLTPLIIEVKRLAQASDLVPTSYSYTRGDQTQPTTSSGRATRASLAEAPDATVVMINFSVQGSYEQVRRLINLLELSEQFVIIDQVSLSSSAGTTLTLNLQLKTIFHDTAAKPAAAGRRS